MSSGWKNWSIGNVPSVDEWHDFWQDQVLFQFADATARDSGTYKIPSTPTDRRKEGMVAVLQDVDELTVFTGSTNGWKPFGRYGAWNSITNLGLYASGTNPTLGTGPTQKARWNRIGTTAILEIFLKFGSSGAAVGSGMYEIEIPSAIAPNSNLYGAEEFVAGSGYAVVQGTRKVVLPRIISASRFRLVADGLTGDVTDSNLGAGWSPNGDLVFSGTLTYEVAQAS